MKFRELTSALIQALSPGRGSIIRRLSQKPATGFAVRSSENLDACDFCPLSPGERARVRILPTRSSRFEPPNRSADAVVGQASRLSGEASIGCESSASLAAPPDRQDACPTTGFGGRAGVDPKRLGRLVCFVLAALAVCCASIARAETVSIVVPTNAAPRVEFGARKLAEALTAVKLDAVITRSNTAPSPKIWINPPHNLPIAREGFHLGAVGGPGSFVERVKARKPWPANPATRYGVNFGSTSRDGDLYIASSDDSGTLYGCLELAQRIRAMGKLPSRPSFEDEPTMTLRGTAIGMQKPHILPGRKVYEYPYTPELFPWFYDKELWREYLDFLAGHRLNTLYLWNGHPFASLVRLKDYPYAVEVPDDVFAQNVEMFHWLTEECDRRGIWLVQMFYSLLVSRPFAEKHGLDTQLAVPTPEALDYTRKSIAQFVQDYPNVGLLVCLGEAMQDVKYQLPFLTNTVLGGVKDGMAAAGLREQPPVVVRAHATDPYTVMPAAVQVYSNIYTMAKYNGESLTTWEPRGEWQKRHLTMSQLTSNHVVNVHILANLEPFRYNAPRFIQKCVQAARDRLGATGLHLYPLYYWDWPTSPDITPHGPGGTPVPLKQWERDWMWFEAWARYAWNPDIPEPEDRAYWVARLTGCYGNAGAAEKILAVGNDAGECAPRLLRRFGITEGNRQTLSLGMTLDQLVNPQRYRPYDELWKSQAPPGERLDEFARKEWNNEPHEGETPVSIIREVLEYSQRAMEAMDAAAPLVTRNRAEFERFRNDVRCIRAMSEHYAGKVEAALHVLRYQYSRDLADMERAVAPMEQSFAAFQRLAALTERSYTAAHSMQTGHRKIPFPGAANGIGTNYHWVQVLPLYEKELAEFKAHVAELKQPKPAGAETGAPLAAWPAANFKLISTNAETYEVKIGARPFADRQYTLTELAPELNGLTGIRFSHEEAKNGRYLPVEFEVAEPVRVLIGYFQSDRDIWLQVPNLDFASHADERGGLDVVLRNAAAIDECPDVNVHAFRYEPGRHKLELIGKGGFVVLGVVPQSVELKRRDAGKGTR